VNLKCGKCQTEFAIPPEVLRTSEPRAECPSCGARYRLKQRTGLLPADVATAGDLRMRTTPSLPLPSPPAATPPATAPPPAGRLTTPLPADPDSATVVSTGGLSAGRLRLGGPVFSSGDLVSGRYRIVRFLAQGGMGEVYEAEDVELRQEVALKTVSAHIGGDPAAIDRFKREIALARRVTHPNVCRIFDLGQHVLPPFPDGQSLPPLTFLTMELLRGETLSQLLRRRGRLSVEEALPLIEQMGAALDAAHRAQIVHRDFKSENVFLVPDAGGPRAVVTDFGVARGADASDRFAAQVTGLGIVGTPAYMAPEQVENKEITAAADLYALGIVIYEMVTGRLPFESPNPLTTAVKRLKEPPPPPHVLVPDLPAYWEKAILRCLEREPQGRFASAGELVQALRKPTRTPRTAEVRLAETARPATATLPVAPPRPAPTRPPKTPLGRSAKLGLVLLAVVLISAGLATFNYLKRGKEPGAVKLRRAVAVFGLKNLTQQEDAAWISTAAAEMLSTELARAESLRAISGQQVTEARQELKLENLATPGRPELEKIRARLGCDYVVAGSYLSLPGGGQLRIDLQLLDASSGGQVGSFSEQGALTELLPIISRLGDGLRKSLGGKAGGEDAEAGLPKNAEAGRLYAEALDALRAAQPLEARQLLEKAAAAENDNPLIHSALASAWSALGYSGKAAEEARKAFELSTRLPREEKLLIEGRLREAEGNSAAARDLYRTLFEGYPDDLDYGLSLVAAERGAGSAKAALDTVDLLRRLPAPLSDDVRIDLAEADAAAQSGLFERQRIAAERAVGKARQQGARLQLARALLQKAQSQRLLGKSEVAAEAAREALALFTEMTHPVGRAQALNVLASCLLGGGRIAESATAAEQAAGLYREVGDQGGLAASLNNLAIARKRQGDLDRVGALYGETEQIYRQTGDRRGLALALNNLAVLLVERDRLAEARKMFESSRPGWEEVAGKLGGALSTFNLAQVARLEGRLEEARQLHQQAATVRQEAGVKPEHAASLAQLAGVLLEAGQVAAAAPLVAEARRVADEVGERSLQATISSQEGELAFLRGDFQAAREALQKALDSRLAGHEALLVPGCKLALARLSLAEKVPIEATQLAREALEDEVTRGRRAEEVRAAAILALAFAADGDGQEGRRVLGGRGALAAATEQPYARLLFGLAEATLQAESDGKGALLRLEALGREAREHLFLPLALEIDQAWVKAAERAGRGAEAAAKQQAIEAEAKSKGLVLHHPG
jgi:serine/threonine protein kinase/TolB-like protein/DNA-directed RNA polymerase subunit RPC12/RpoP